MRGHYERVLLACALLAGLGFSFPVAVRHHPVTSLIDIDLTTGSFSSLLNYSRTGSPVCYQTSETTVSCTSATNQAICENRGTDDNAGYGCWVFPGYQNIPGTTADNDFGPTQWPNSSSPSPTATNNVTAGPDGTTTAGKIEDTDPSTVQYLGNVYSGDANPYFTVSVWKKDATPTPTSSGFLSEITTFNNLTSLGSGTTWHRYVYRDLSNQMYAFSPAGNSAAETGAIYAWGPSKVDSQFDLPLLTSPLRTSSQAYITLGSTALSQMLPGGDLDFEVEYIPAGDYPEGQLDSYLWHCDTPDGVLAVNARISSYTQPTVEFYARGSLVAHLSTEPVGYKGSLWSVRTWYHVSTGKGGFRIRYNGAGFLDATFAASGSPLAAPTACWIGSYDDGSTVPGNPFSMGGRVTKIKNYQFSPDPATTPEFLLIGDSRTAGTSSSPWGQFLYTPSQARTRPGVAWTAIGGDTTYGQTTTYNASPWKTATSIRAIVILLDINNIHDVAHCDDDTTVETQLQNMVNLVHGDHPTAHIYVMKGFPAKSYLLTQTCGSHSGAQMETYMENVAAWLHAGSLTGADIIEDAADDIEDPGSPHSLKATCDVNSPYTTPDGVHPTSSCARVVGLDVRARFIADGLLPP